MKWYSTLVLLIVVLSSDGTILGQTNKDNKPASGKKDSTSIYLDIDGINRLVNKCFSGIVSGQSNSTTLTNYASLDPSNGTLLLKGSIPVHVKHDSTKLSYLTLRISGDLLSDNYTVLFNNSKLNTNSSFESQYHIGLTKGIKINYLKSSDAKMIISKDLINKQLEYYSGILDSGNLIKLKHFEEIKLAFQRNDLLFNESRYKEIDSILSKALITKKLALKEEKKFNDSLSVYHKQISILNKSISATILKIDSLNDVLNNYFYLQQSSKFKLETATDDAIRDLELNAPFTGIRFGWLSFLIGFSRKDFYSFDALSSFRDQIKKNDLITLKFGLTYNHYTEKSFPRRICFFNVGLLYQKDNNTSLLSTKEITQSILIKNSAGDTARTITNKYNVYVDPINTNKIWSLFGNVYLIHSSRTNAFHLFPAFDLYDTGKLLINNGIGYLMSFKNSKKDDKPVINVEGYILFTDLLNQLDESSKFWKRNKIGIRIALPFTFLN